jgi:beta-lactamase regulating signal transducer with metallopeptidase domain
MGSWLQEIAGSRVLESIGWALIHSIWQALIIAALLWAFLKISSEHIKSGARYIIAMAAQWSLLLWMVLWVTKSLNTVTGGLETVGLPLLVFTGSMGQAAPVGLTLQEDVVAFINSNIAIFMAFWLVGVVFYLIRITGGLTYIGKLRSSAVPVEHHIQVQAKRISDKYGIKDKFEVAISALIEVPMVIGHLRPLILFPAGILSSLTIEEIRGILAHELAHIRRNDYLINIIQSVVEAIYFFNPFMWWMSRMIREERECACDELAVACMDERRTYAEALIRIGELNYGHKPAISLGMAGNKKKGLIKRIERVMKRKTNSKSTNWIPAIILVVTLIIPAILIAKDIGDSKFHNGNVAGPLPELVIPDPRMDESAMEKNNFPELKSTVLPADTIPDEEEEIEMEESMDIDVDTDLEIEVAPDLDIAFDFDFDPMIAPDFDFDLDLPPMPPVFLDYPDTFPKNWNEEEWEKFSEEFRAEMEEYRVEMEDFRVHMEHFKQEFQESFGDWEKEHREAMKELRESLGEEMESLELERFMQLQEKMMSQLEASDWQERLEKEMAEMEKQLQMLPDLQEHLQEMEFNLQNELAHLEEFENELKEMLLEDGYIEEGDKVNIEFDDEDIKINGESIKDKDKKKYLDLRKKYFPRDEDNFRYRMN